MSRVKRILDKVLGIDPGREIAGRERSAQWPAVEKAHLKNHPTCAACGGRKHVNAHHVLPYHLYPEHELDPENLVTLCRGTFNCHLLFGHLGNYASFNPLVRAMCEMFHFLLRSSATLLKQARDERRQAKAKKRKAKR